MRVAAWAAGGACGVNRGAEVRDRNRCSDAIGVRGSVQQLPTEADLEGGQFGPRAAGRAVRVALEPACRGALQYVSSSMPPNGGGSLSDSEYAGLVAMILTANGVPRAADAAQSPPPVTSPADASADRPASNPFEDMTYARDVAARRKLLGANLYGHGADAGARHPLRIG